MVKNVSDSISFGQEIARIFFAEICLECKGQGLAKLSAGLISLHSLTLLHTLTPLDISKSLCITIMGKKIIILHFLNVQEYSVQKRPFSISTRTHFHCVGLFSGAAAWVRFELGGSAPR